MSYSNITFLDRFGNELFLPLTGFSFDGANTTTTSFVTGYSVATTIDAAAVFLFSSGSNNVYVYIPFTTAAVTVTDNTNPNIVDLTATSAPSNSLSSWDGNGALTPFNFLIQTDYNQWYTASINSDTVLISNFVYKISSVNNANPSAIAPASTLTSLSWSAAVIASTG